MLNAEIHFGEDGSRVGIADFDYDPIERSLFSPEDVAEAAEGLNPEAREIACKMFLALTRWVWHDGSKNPDGITLRAIIVCWVFIPEVTPLTLTELAIGFGKDKQSFGRHVDEFKRFFPFLITHNMRAVDETQAQKQTN